MKKHVLLSALIILFAGLTHAQTLHLGMKWDKVQALLANKHPNAFFPCECDAEYDSVQWMGLTGTYNLDKDSNGRLVRIEFFAHDLILPEFLNIWKNPVLRVPENVKNIGSSDSEPDYVWRRGNTQYTLSYMTGDLLYEMRDRDDYLSEQLYGKHHASSRVRVISDSVVRNGHGGFRTRFMQVNDGVSPHGTIPSTESLRVGMPWDTVRAIFALSDLQPVAPKSRWSSTRKPAKWHRFAGEFFLLRDSLDRLRGYDFIFGNGALTLPVWKQLLLSQIKEWGKPSHVDLSMKTLRVYQWDRDGIRYELVRLSLDRAQLNVARIADWPLDLSRIESGLE